MEGYHHHMVTSAFHLEGRGHRDGATPPAGSCGTATATSSSA